MRRHTRFWHLSCVGKCLINAHAVLYSKVNGLNFGLSFPSSTTCMGAVRALKMRIRTHSREPSLLANALRAEISYTDLYA